MLLKISMPRSQIFEALAKLKKPPIDVAAEIPFAAQRAFDKNKALMGMAPPPKGNFSPSSSKTLRTIVAELSAMDSLRLLQQLERPSMEEKLYDPQPRNKDMMGGPIGMAKMYSDNSVSKPSATMEKPISIEELLKRKPNVKVPESKAVEALKQVLSRAKHGNIVLSKLAEPGLFDVEANGYTEEYTIEDPKDGSALAHYLASPYRGLGIGIPLGAGLGAGLGALLASYSKNPWFGKRRLLNTGLGALGGLGLGVVGGEIADIIRTRRMKNILRNAPFAMYPQVKQGSGAPFPSVAQHILPYPPNGGNPLLRPGPFGTGVHPDTSQKTEDDGIPPYLKMQLADTVGDVITAIMRSKGA